MPYIFPDRVLKSQDILDPVELNNDFIPSAELYSGRLDEHNFASTTSYANTTDTFFNEKYKENAVDMGLTISGSSSTSYEMPNSDTFVSYGDGIGPTDSYFVPNDGSWGLVGEMTLTMSTSEAVLWLVATVQYTWSGFSDATTNWNTGTVKYQHLFSSSFLSNGGTAYDGLTRVPAKLQFALQVNGQIIPWTITGMRNLDAQGIVPLRPASSRNQVPTSTTPAPAVAYATPISLPGPRQARFFDVQAIGPEVASVRLGAMFPVSASSNVVQLVVRRLSLDAASASPYCTGEKVRENNAVYLHNRQLYVMEAPTFPGSAATFDSVSTDAYDSEEVISAQSLGNDRVDAVRDKYNAVASGAPARGAFNHNHLTSPVSSQTEQVIIAPTSNQTLNNKYPGFNTPTVTTGSTSADTGWYNLNDGSGTPTYLKVQNVAISEACSIVIMANVQVPRVGTIPLPGSAFGAFSLIYKTASSAPTVISVSEAIYSKIHGSAEDTELDVALFARLEFGGTSGLTIENLDYIGVYGSMITPNLAGAPYNLKYRRGNLIVLKLDKE
tara:strand:+ start:1275 stop:2936 length:1662 start_codon:yes stop_codon:yes gene_type:complete